MESDPSNIVSQLILIGGLTLINAFFASAEMAIVSVNKNKIKKLGEEGNKKAKLLEKLIEEPSNFLSTIQVGITLAGFFSSASAATGISDDVSQALSGLGIPYTQQISMIGVTLILSYFTLVFGELVPKRIALKKAESIALLSAKPIYILSVLAKPFIKILTLSTGLVLKLAGHDKGEENEKVSEEEVRCMILQSQQDGCIADEEQQMIEGVFEFNDKTVKEIMTPRKDTFMVDISLPIHELVDFILEQNYSRIPVYKHHIDQIVGVIYMKDLLREAKNVGFENIELQHIIHKAFFVPETQKTNNLFKQLKAKQNHMAILIDEYGGFSGIVTMEDLIEEILGDIADEYDIEQLSIRQINEHTYQVQGSTPLYRIRQQLQLELEEGEYDTLNGYLLTQLGVIPTSGTCFEHETEEAVFKVTKMGNKCIEEVEVILRAS